jgi:hypothetical protein
MQSRLRRLHTIKHPSDLQIRRAFRLRLEIAKLTSRPMKSSSVFILQPCLPECFVSCFEQGEKWRRHWKFAAQMLWTFPKPEIVTICFSTN